MRDRRRGSSAGSGAPAPLLRSTPMRRDFFQWQFLFVGAFSCAGPHVYGVPFHALFMCIEARIHGAV